MLLCGDFLWNMVFPCIQCGKEVRPRQHAVDCDWCGQWTHRQCGTGMSIRTLIIYELKVINDDMLSFILANVTMARFSPKTGNDIFIIRSF